MIFVGIGMTGNFVGGGDRPPGRLPPGDCDRLRAVLRHGRRRLHLAPLVAGPAVLVRADRHVPGDFRPLYDVSAVALPHAACEPRGPASATISAALPRPLPRSSSARSTGRAISRRQSSIPVFSFCPPPRWPCSCRNRNDKGCAVLAVGWDQRACERRPTNHGHWWAGIASSLVPPYEPIPEVICALDHKAVTSADRPTDS